MAGRALEERLYSPSVRGVLCNPPVLHNLEQSAVPMFAPGNQPPPPPRCAVSRVREQPGFSPCRRSFFFSSTLCKSVAPRSSSRADVRGQPAGPAWRLEGGGGKVDSLCSWCIMTAIFQCDTCTLGVGESAGSDPSDTSLCSRTSPS